MRRFTPQLLLMLMVTAGFVPIFAGWRFHFWYQMGLTVLLFIALGARIWPSGPAAMRLSLKEKPLRALFLGMGSAVLLYAVFYVGNIISQWLLPFAKGQIGGVYDFKSGASIPLMTSLIVLVIGPGEEILWRGILQHAFEDRWGWRGILLSTGLYAAVHMASGNMMLVAAAAVCGAFWAFTYWKFRSITLNIVSHVLWDVAVFLLFPFN